MPEIIWLLGFAACGVPLTLRFGFEGVGGIGRWSRDAVRGLALMWAVVMSTLVASLLSEASIMDVLQVSGYLLIVLWVLGYLGPVAQRYVSQVCIGMMWVGMVLVVGALWSSLFGEFSIAGIEVMRYRRVGVELGGISVSGSSGPLWDSNYFGRVLAICFAFTARVVVRGSGLNARLAGPVMVGLLVGVALSGSRAALGSIVVFLVLYGWLVPEFRRVGLALGVAAGLLAVFESGTVDEIIQLERGLTGRDDLWAESMRYVEERPWGLGAGARVEVAGIIAGRVGGASVHNSYLNAFLLGGIVGGGAYLLLWALVLWKAWRWRRRIDGMWLALLGGTAVHQLFQTYMLGGIGFLPITTAMAVSVVLGASEAHGVFVMEGEGAREVRADA